MNDKTVKMTCPTCENEIALLESEVGTQKRCPNCKGVFWAKKSMVKHETHPAVCIALGFIVALIAGAFGNKISHSAFLPFGIVGGAAGIIAAFKVKQGKGAVMAIIGFVVWFLIALVVRIAGR